MKIIQKTLRIALSVVLLFSLIACAKPIEEMNDPPEDNRPVIAAKLPYTFDCPNFDGGVPSIEQVYMSSELMEQLELNKDEDVLYRVAVSVIWCLETTEEDQKEKIDFIKNFSSNSIPVDNFPELVYGFGGYGHIMELTAEEINVFNEKGGYYIRLVPPGRAEGYDEKISDILTVMLEQATDTEVFEVTAVLVADKNNNFARNQYIWIDSEHNAHLFKGFEISPYEFVNGEGCISGEGDVIRQCITSEQIGKEKLYDKFIMEYIMEIVERNGLSDKLTDAANFEKAVGFDGDFSAFEEKQYHMGYQEHISAGFNANLTRSEILKLINDEDIKVLYPLSLKGCSKISDNE